MKNIFIIAPVVAFIFLIVKFIEMRFVERETKPLKVFARETLFVYFSVIIGNFILEQLKPIIQEGGLAVSSSPTAVFTDNPSF
jgi:hypothetical protein